LEAVAPGQWNSSIIGTISFSLFLMVTVLWSVPVVLLIALFRASWLYPWSLIPGLWNVYRLLQWVPFLFSDPVPSNADFVSLPPVGCTVVLLGSLTVFIVTHLDLVRLQINGE